VFHVSIPINFFMFVVIKILFRKTLRVDWS
jgi:hypothetical protein